MKTFTHPKLEAISLSAVMQALADPCRQQIVITLKEADGRGLACNEFELEVSKATASHHFETLRSAGIIESRSEGVKCLSSLRENEMNERFPGLLDLVAAEG
ncbi:MAG: DNA-binding transcriptional ArsR family regulator [Candidatus Pelagisphaera sp.]|jgi:DNA-binding transcriptional ArsR family regulator